MTNAPLRRELHEANRLSWNEATKAHNSHKADQAKFLREGGSTLFPEEQELLKDISGLSLLHLQCNSGQDTLSLAQLGAVVTGVDISDEAIAFAQHLSQESTTVYDAAKTSTPSSVTTTLCPNWASLQSCLARCRTPPSLSQSVSC